MRRVFAICYHRPDERDVSDRQETNQDGATDDPGVPGVVPVQERVPLTCAEPHLAETTWVIIGVREIGSVIIILTYGTGGARPLATELQLSGERSGLASYLARYRASNCWLAGLV